MNMMSKPDEKWRRVWRKAKKWIETLLFVASLLFIGFVVWHLFLFASFSIPSESMSPTIQPGDRVLVDKVTTGARLFDILGASAGKDIKIHRMPHFRKFKRGDILVFNFPFRGKQNKIDMDIRLYYAKRCVGAPGDTLEIRDFNYYINGVPSEGGGDRSSARAIYAPDSISRDSLPGFKALRKDSVTYWTIRDFGPLYIPRKGEMISLNTGNYMPYKKVIEWETGSKLKNKGGVLTLDGKPVRTYRFKENYYFMAGDNSGDSQDSRYWGFVPEPFIVGRALLIWWSERNETVNKERVMTWLN